MPPPVLATHVETLIQPKKKSTISMSIPARRKGSKRRSSSSPPPVVVPWMARRPMPTMAYLYFFALFMALCRSPMHMVAAAAAGCPNVYSVTISDAAVAAKAHANRNKLIIAHRGASYHLPEHTLAGYRLALEMGADFVEPDLVATADGHLIAMHTMDLNVTTDVETKFGHQRPPQFSPYLNQTGYWSYMFALAEIKTMRVRQRLPRGRSTLYDGMFEVPTFEEIQQLVTEWNTQVVPQMLMDPAQAEEEEMNNITTPFKILFHEHHPQSAGIYAEIKAAPWLARDTNISLVDLFYQHFQDSPDIFAPILTCPSEKPKFDDYTVPPIVIQCFDQDVLQNFLTKWNQHPTTANAPLPPAILLVPKTKCWEEDFWFELGDTLRGVIQGVGVDKACLTPAREEEAMALMDRAKEFKLVVHPYTERPEHEYLLPGFANSDEEMQYLLCKVGVQGVFTESLHGAIFAARSGCLVEHLGVEQQEGVATSTSISSNSGNSNTTGNRFFGNNNNSTMRAGATSCVEAANLYVGLATFGLGVLVTLLISCGIPLCRRRRATRAHRLPTEDDNVHVELDDDDAEML